MADAAHYFYATPHAGADSLSPSSVTDAVTPALTTSGGRDSRTLEWTQRGAGGGDQVRGERATALKPPQIMMPLRLLVAGHGADAGDRRGAGAARPRDDAARGSKAGLAL